MPVRRSQILPDGKGFTGRFGAADGIDALRLIETSEVDLAVLDLGTPERQGNETIQALRRVRPQLKIVATSDDIAGPILQAAERLGIEMLAKPIQPYELLDAIARIIVGR